MKTNLLLLFTIMLLFGCSNIESPTGQIMETELDTYSITLSSKLDSTAVRSKKPSWSITCITLRDSLGADIRYNNTGYIKHYPDGSKIQTMHEQMECEWIKLIQSDNLELKVIVKENIADATRYATVYLGGCVGYFSAKLEVIQKGKLDSLEK